LAKFRLAGSIFSAHSGSLFHKTNAHRVPANALSGCPKDEVQSFEEVTTTKSPVWQGI
jgi:hypothetical protein